MGLIRMIVFLLKLAVALAVAKFVIGVFLIGAFLFLMKLLGVPF